MSKKRMLLIEENLDYEALIRRSVRGYSESIEIYTARNPQEAAELLFSPLVERIVTPDLIVIDFQREIGSALEFVQLLKLEPSLAELPVVVLLSKENESMGEDFERYGAKKPLAKWNGLSALRDDMLRTVGAHLGGTISGAAL